MTEVIVQALGVQSGSCEPQALGRLTNAEDALQRIGSDAFGEQGECRTYDLGRSAEAIECRVAPGGEFALASLTAEIGDVVVAVETVTHEGMHPSIRN